MLNRRHNELHESFGAGPSAEAEQLRLLSCRPELAAQKDAEGNLPLHIAAASGATLRAAEECMRIFPKAPKMRNMDGFRPHQLVSSPSRAPRGMRGVALRPSPRVRRVACRAPRARNARGAC